MTDEVSQRVLASLGQLVAGLADSGKYCLISPDGTCFMDEDPMRLAVFAIAAKDAKIRPPTNGEGARNEED